MGTYILQCAVRSIGIEDYATVYAYAQAADTGALIGAPSDWTATLPGQLLPPVQNTPAVTVTGTNAGTATITGRYSENPSKQDSLGLYIVEVASLLPDSNPYEVDDGDNNPDIRTFVVNMTTNVGDVVTVTATPNPIKSDLPDCWTLTGGTGSGKLKRIIDRTTPSGPNVLTCTCGTSTKTTTIWVVQCKYTAYANSEGLGHAWWQYQLSPSDAVNLVPAGIRIWANMEVGYWPAATPLPPNFEAPGIVAGGSQPGYSPTAPDTSQHTWVFPFVLLNHGLMYCKTLNDNPGTYSLFGNNCCHKTIQGAGAVGVSIPSDKTTPQSLHDYLSGL